MSKVEKLYLVPEDILDSLRQSSRGTSVSNPQATVSQRLDREIQNNLNNPEISNTDKALLHSQYLASYLTAHDKQHRPSQTPHHGDGPQVPLPEVTKILKLLTDIANKDTSKTQKIARTSRLPKTRGKVVTSAEAQPRYWTGNPSWSAPIQHSDINEKEPASESEASQDEKVCIICT